MNDMISTAFLGVMYNNWKSHCLNSVLSRLYIVSFRFNWINTTDEQDSSVSNKLPATQSALIPLQHLNL